MANHFLFTDPTTLEALRTFDAKRVLLFGSYSGFNNFGDVLQLKGAIRFHQTTTGLRPVVVCAISAVSKAGYIDDIRRWFGVEEVLFVADEPFDASHLNLEPLREAPLIHHLHMYGGGFLNRYWGRAFVSHVEFLLSTCQVAHYVVSGQQISPEFVPALKAHFGRYRPAIAGGRDAASAEVIRSCGLAGGFSFDDSTEILLGWLARRPAQPPSEGTERQLLLHLNTSDYAGRDDAGLYLARLVALRARYATTEPPMLLQAYNDVRLSVKDTLASVVALDGSFPYTRYGVLDLARMSLELDPAAQTDAPELASLAGGLGLSSSYHVGLFLNMAGVPCFLHARNDYYQQKLDGLGIAGTFEEFLEAPEAVSFELKLAERRAWIGALEQAYATWERPAFQPAGRLLEIPDRRASFHLKHDELGALREVLARYQTMAAPLLRVRNGLNRIRGMLSRR